MINDSMSWLEIWKQIGNKWSTMLTSSNVYQLPGGCLTSWYKYKFHQMKSTAALQQCMEAQLATFKDRNGTLSVGWVGTNSKWIKTSKTRCSVLLHVNQPTSNVKNHVVVIRKFSIFVRSSTQFTRKMLYMINLSFSAHAHLTVPTNYG